MLPENNGNAARCAFNILSCVRGEVPYERCKGLDGDLTDKAMTSMCGMLVADVAWNLRNYEPRLEPEDVNIFADNILSGDIRIGITADIVGEEGR